MGHLTFWISLSLRPKTETKWLKFGLTVWNSLGVHARSADTFLTFKNRHKTQLLKSCYL